MSSPSVSVCMPVYNTERYVAEAVESILAQTFGDFEFIIIDDGSTDGSRAILERYAKQDDRIRLISRPNTGVVGARNEALGLARGELIAVMDSDDMALPERFERQLSYLADHPDCVGVGSRTMLIDPEGDALLPTDEALMHEEIDAGLLNSAANVYVHPTLMLRRQAVLAVGGYRYPIAEDYDLLLRLAEIGRLANLPDILLHYRQHHRNATYLQGDSLWRGIETIVQEACRRRQVPYEYTPRTGSPPADEAILEKWGWWALSSGHVRTARKHAFRTLRKSPLKLSSWRLLACALRGR